jgi:ADP-ribose pyrophosphatase YjhB (NUDIX family)
VTGRLYPDRPFVGAICALRRAGRVLLVQRAAMPGRGLWGFPGGMQELGETVFEAAVRELFEETGIVARPLDLIGQIDRIERDPDGRVRSHWTLLAVAAEWERGEPDPGEDALAVAWTTPEELEHWPGDLFPSVPLLVGRALAWRGD